MVCVLGVAWGQKHLRTQRPSLPARQWFSNRVPLGAKGSSRLGRVSCGSPGPPVTVRAWGAVLILSGQNCVAVK